MSEVTRYTPIDIGNELFEGRDSDYVRYDDYDALRKAAQQAAAILQQIINDDDTVIQHSILKDAGTALTALEKAGVTP